MHASRNESRFGSPPKRLIPISVISLVALTLAVCLTTLNPATAAAVSTEHAFDPVLSLNGECSVSKADPVVDPGLCPMPPGVAGVDHPPTPFDRQLEDVTVAPGGYIYVASFGGEKDGRIDIFNPAGEYITEVKEESGAGQLAVNSSCDLYVGRFNLDSGGEVVRYTPSSCPVTKTTTYGAPSRVEDRGFPARGLALDFSNDHLFVSKFDRLIQHKTDGTVDGTDEVQRLAVDATSGTFNLRVFADTTDKTNIFEPHLVSSGVDGSGDLEAGSAVVTSVIGAAGSGNLKVGSTAVTSLTATTGLFGAGEPIAGPGIPAGTTILEVTDGSSASFLRLSQPATVTADSVSLVSHGLGRFAQGEVNREIFGPGIPAGTTIKALQPADDSLVLSADATADVSNASLSAGEKGMSTGGTGSGEVTSGSPVVTSFSSAKGTGTTISGETVVSALNTTSGAFRRGELVTGTGIAAGTAIKVAVPGQLTLSKPAVASGSGVELTAVDPIAKGEAISGPGISPGTTVEALSSETLTLSAAATASISAANLSAAIPFDASPETVEAAITAMPIIGAGTVSVSGGPGGAGAVSPYLVSFEGALASTDVAQLGAEGAGLSGGGASASVTTSVEGYDGSFGATTLKTGFQGAAVDAKTDELFVAAQGPGENASAPTNDSVYIFDLADGHLKGRVDGTDVPGAAFRDGGYGLALAVDEASGELFVDNAVATRRIYRMVRGSGAEYHYLADPELDQHSYAEDHSFVAVDNDATSPNHRHVFVSSNTSPAGHVFAFGPPVETGPPIVTATSSSSITSTEASLAAEVNPHGAATEYRFQYVEEATYLHDVEELGDGHGFDHAASTGAGSLPVGNQPLPISTSLSSLSPGTAYRFRVLATSHCEPKNPEATCVAEGEGAGPEMPHRFATYLEGPSARPCPNEALRTGASSRLPDCRAYELVTPPDTNGRVPTRATFGGSGGPFDTQIVSPAGTSVLFMTTGGALPGLSGGGGFRGDGYEALRQAGAGWQTRSVEPSGAQAVAPEAGGASPDHGHQIWSVVSAKGEEGGSLSIEGKRPTYVREPDGDFRLLGEGSLATDLEAKGRWISAGASHLIFTSRIKLEEGAPETDLTGGSEGVYDRTPDGVTHVISQLPGGPVPPSARVLYQGSSADGTAVAFKVTGAGTTTLYVRLDDAETIPVATGNTTFAGLSADGRRLTYLVGGDIFSFDTASESTEMIGSGGKSTVVNVSADGSHVYFVSSQILSQGGGPVKGKDNLYVWKLGAVGVAFIATLDHLDVTGTTLGDGQSLGALGSWTDALSVGANGLASDPSRTTPNGETLVFESHADLSDYAALGHAEVYRYDAAAEDLSCLSCNPTRIAASSDASLEGSFELGSVAHTSRGSHVQNVSDDGRRIFFQSAEALVPGDVDRTQDVYEWQKQGTGGCADPGGCLALVSSGHSGSPNYLYAVSADGHDVFFTSSDLLVGADKDGTSSIYDARINGGFADVASQPCSGEACKGPPSSASPLPGVANAAGSSNGGAGSRCEKGQRRVQRHGRAHCAAKRHRKRHGPASKRRDGSRRVGGSR